MKNTLQSLLAAGKTKQTIAELRKITVSDSDLHHQVIQLAARFAAYEKQFLGNLENPAVLRVELAQINHALLAAMEDLSENASVGKTSSHAVTTPTIIQNAEKIYNIDHIDNANFS